MLVVNIIGKSEFLQPDLLPKLLIFAFLFLQPEISILYFCTSEIKWNQVDSNGLKCPKNLVENHLKAENAPISRILKNHKNH